MPFRCADGGQRRARWRSGSQGHRQAERIPASISNVLGLRVLRWLFASPIEIYNETRSSRAPHGAFGVAAGRHPAGHRI